MNTCVPPSWPSVPPPPHNQSHPARPRQSTWLSSLLYAPTSCLLCIWQWSHVNPSLNSSRPPPHVHISSPYVFISMPARLHIYMLRYDMFFLFLTYFTLYEKLYIHPQDTENCINVSRNKTCIFRWWKSGRDFITPHLDLGD